METSTIAEIFLTRLLRLLPCCFESCVPGPVGLHPGNACPVALAFSRSCAEEDIKCPGAGRGTSREVTVSGPQPCCPWPCLRHVGPNRPTNLAFHRPLASALSRSTLPAPCHPPVATLKSCLGRGARGGSLLGSATRNRRRRGGTGSSRTPGSRHAPTLPAPRCSWPMIQVPASRPQVILDGASSTPTVACRRTSSYRGRVRARQTMRGLRPEVDRSHDSP